MQLVTADGMTIRTKSQPRNHPLPGALEAHAVYQEAGINLARPTTGKITRISKFRSANWLWFMDQDEILACPLPHGLEPPLAQKGGRALSNPAQILTKAVEIIRCSALRNAHNSPAQG